MGALSQINLGIVGAGRGASFKEALDALKILRPYAICDTNRQALDNVAGWMGAEAKYTDYPEMLDSGKVDAVLLATPMPLHVPQAIEAIGRGISVLSEVTAGVSVEECRKLVAACKSRPDVIYMMGENFPYQQSNQVIAAMVHRGEFGTPYYAEGEYLHEMRALNERTPWRRKWLMGVNGPTYITHSLGPILTWFWAHDASDRVVSVCCAGSGHHYRDSEGKVYENEDSCVMLGRMRSGGLIKIRVDMQSNRPGAECNLQLQGTRGCYESARAEGEKNRIWLQSGAGGPNRWRDLSEVEEGFIPERWIQWGAQARQCGHRGSDLLELVDFAEALEGNRPCAFGIHEAMDMTLPGLIGQQSIGEEGRWIDVPDSRQW